jgi:hypothetical protein
MQRFASTGPAESAGNISREAHQMIESMTSFSCVGDIVNSVAKQCFVIACSRLKNCSRCSG